MRVLVAGGRRDQPLETNDADVPAIAVGADDGVEAPVDGPGDARVKDGDDVGPGQSRQADRRLGSWFAEATSQPQRGRTLPGIDNDSDVSDWLRVVFVKRRNGLDEAADGDTRAALRRTVADVGRELRCDRGDFGRMMLGHDGRHARAAQRDALYVASGGTLRLP